MHAFRCILFIFALFCGCSDAFAAGRRVALVIGNSAYQKVPALANPANDAGSVASLLRRAQFDVVEFRQNLGGSDLRRAMSEFFDQSASADVAVVFYAGHGIEVEGVNYLIPIDAALARDRDVYDEAVSLDRVLQAVESARRLRLVILDACRDNPFVRSMKRTVASRAISRGLAGVEPNRSNTLIAFAAKAGATAGDGDGVHSPFTTALLQHLTTPGLDLRKVFGIVRDEVLTATGDRQEPFVYGSLGGADVSLVPEAIESRKGDDLTPMVRKDYEFAERVGTREAWESFIATHRDPYYVGLANAQRIKLTEAEEKHSVASQATTPPLDGRPKTTEGPKVASLGSKGPEGSTPSQPAPSSAKYGTFCSHRQALCIAKAAGRNWIVGMCRSEYPQCLSTGVWHGPSGKTWSAVGR